MVKDITGKRSNKLIAIRNTLLKSPNKDYLWECLCDCGNTTTVSVGNFNSGHTKSCGCAFKEARQSRLDYHGMSKTKEFKAWSHIKDRCYNEKSKAYKYYGRKGVRMDAEWVDGFMNFYNHIGPCPDDGDKYSVDRIDTSKSYVKGNVRWATHTQQSRNKGMPKNNTSGVKGVNWENKKHPDGKTTTLYAVAQWKDLLCKNIKKSYSVKKYGKELAFFLACEKREIEIEKLNLMGAGYSEGHRGVLTNE